MIMKTMTAISVICFAAALALNEESSWTKLFDDQVNDGLDFIENDKRSYKRTTCCRRTEFRYESDLPRKDKCIRQDESDRPRKGKCIRQLKVVSSYIPRQHGQYLNGSTFFLGGKLILHKGILYESMYTPKKCH